MTAPELPEHWFRRELGRLVSILSRRFGVHRLELCEDAAQTALLQATQSWSSKLPDEPGAWLYRVAHNYVLDELRREKRDERYLAEVHVDYAQQEVYGRRAPAALRLRRSGDPARVAARPRAENTLRFQHRGDRASTVSERRRHSQAIAACARAAPRARGGSEHRSGARVQSVLHMLYLLFNEGYSSAQPDRVIRRELCDEALRLALMLREDPAGALPETDALVALMCFHAARFDARVDGMGGLLLLEEQDRSLWDRELVHRGLVHLMRSARGETPSRYHAEAGIAAEHCLAPSYAETNWDGDRPALRGARAHRAVAAQRLESCDRACRVEGTRRRACRARGRSRCRVGSSDTTCGMRRSESFIGGVGIVTALSRTRSAPLRPHRRTPRKPCSNGA